MRNYSKSLKRKQRHNTIDSQPKHMCMFMLSYFFRGYKFQGCREGGFQGFWKAHKFLDTLLKPDNLFRHINA